MGRGFGWVIWLAIAVSVASSVRWSARYWFRGWGTDADGLDPADRKGRRRTRERFEALEVELAERTEALQLLEARVNELESRLDFTERLLARAKEPALPTS
jgi:hypothetical protein